MNICFASACPLDSAFVDTNFSFFCFLLIWPGRWTRVYIVWSLPLHEVEFGMHCKDEILSGVIVASHRCCRLANVELFGCGFKVAVEVAVRTVRSISQLPHNCPPGCEVHIANIQMLGFNLQIVDYSVNRFN